MVDVEKNINNSIQLIPLKNSNIIVCHISENNNKLRLVISKKSITDKQRLSFLYLSHENRNFKRYIELSICVDTTCTYYTRINEVNWYDKQSFFEIYIYCRNIDEKKRLIKLFKK